MSMPNCDYNEEIGSKIVTSLEFAAAVMIFGIAIYSVLSLINFCSDYAFESIRTLLLGIAVIFVLICIVNPEMEDTAESSWPGSKDAYGNRNPVTLFKDLK